MTTKHYCGGELVAEVVRSGFSESFHRGSVAVFNGEGTVVHSVGDIASPVFPRSSAKPFQALAALRAGWKPATEANLAIAAASHRGEEFHVDEVDSLLSSAELGEEALQCPPDLPGDPAARRAVVAHGGAARRVYMNCSGKHSAMVAVSKLNGWDPASYLDPEHPLQQQVAATVEEMTGEDIAATGVDGCGAPLFAYSLTGLGRAFHRLTAAVEGTEERAIADAMRHYPKLIQGSDGVDSKAMIAIDGLVSKGGAEAVQALSIPGVGTVVVKIDDGGQRAAMPVALRALVQHTDFLPSHEAHKVIEELSWPEIYGGGQPVGRLRPLI
ncbi:asparaginase [Haloglycomyces albus]|uniref:asparaginase n=1 Tax=Haloglycomyces albus TaxID=526067 RepID=UPI00046D26F1|nr:asparaginase [Haloglycomyces albus]